MNHEINSRRGFLKGLAGVFGGLGAMAFLTKPAQAGRSRWRGGYGFGGPRWNSHRRWGGPGYYGGYGGYGGYGPGLYNRGPYGGPYLAPGPLIPARPYFYNNGYPPFGSLQTPRAGDALRLLET